MTRTTKGLFALLLLLFSGFGTLFDPAFCYSEGFTLSCRPDLPLRKYAQGKLGIILPTYARSYLYVAYRYLMGNGLSSAEQAACVSLWDERLDLQGVYSRQEDWKSIWLNERARVPDAPELKDFYVSRPVDIAEPYGEEYCNCNKSSFTHAATVLKQRIEKYGLKSAQVKEWLVAQDQVFANCSGVRKPDDYGAIESVSPAPLPDNADPLLKKDRAYQIAAADFYSQNLEAAAREFSDIADDAESPYKDLARYLAERANIRRATLSKEIDLEALRNERERLLALASDQAMGAYKQDILSLLNFINAKLEPEKRLKELTERLVSGKPDDNFRQDLWDFTIVFDNLVGWTPWKAYDENGACSLPDELKGEDLNDWLSNFGCSDKQAEEVAIKRWQSKKSLPWLLAALSKVDSQSPALAPLMAEALKLDEKSPAYLTASYHLVRILSAQGKSARASSMLDSLLARPDLPPSARNSFLSQRIKFAKNLSEFMRLGAREPSENYNDCTYAPEDFAKAESSDSYVLRQQAFAVDVLEVLNNQFPVSMLSQIATFKSLSPALRHQVALAAFVRAIFLSNQPAAEAMALLLKEQSPRMVPYLNAWLEAGSEKTKKFCAAMLLLKFQEFDWQISNLYPGEHWWWSSFGSYGTEDLQPGFLTQKEKDETLKEIAGLEKLPDSNKYLCPIVIAYARSNPDDPRIPEALYLAVRGTHYGARDDEVSGYSKESFVILHKKYPGSPWTAKTKYWY